MSEKELKETHSHDQTHGEILSTHTPENENLENYDEAMRVALNLEGKTVVLDEERDKRLLRKIDFYLLPLVCFLYACQFMDKTTNSYAAVMGLKTDLNMKGDMYSWTGTAFYLGYLVFEFPANALLQRFPLAKTTGVFIFIWGVLLCLHAVPKYGGFIALRTLLGVFESSISPAMVILTGQWYKKEEHFMRTTLWFSSNGFGIILGGLIAYGCAVHEESYSFEAWKVLCIVTGLLTIVISIVFVIHIPDTPSKAWFLTEEERLLVVERIRGNKQGFGNKHFKKYQFKESLFDILTWLFFLYAIASNTPNGGLTNFGSILLLEDFNYTQKQTLLMNCICGAVEIVRCIGFAYCIRWIPQRLIISFAAMALAFSASCMLAFANESKNARLAGYFLQYVIPVPTICSLSCFQSNTAGHTKKITTTAIFFIGYCIGNIIGPQTFTEAPYTGGKIAIVVCEAASLVLILAIYFTYWFMNKKKDQDMKKMDLTEFNHIHNSEFADLTDKENPTFRYCL